jgi:hypothetical protein
MISLWRAVSAVAVLSATSLAAGEPVKLPAAAKPAPTASTAPAELPELARQALRNRMGRHGKDLSLLVHSVVMLQRDLVVDLAHTIATEPRLVRPLPDGRDELNAVLPERFFVLQDELRERAQALSEAARGHDDAELGRRFGLMTQTCVACHSTFFLPRTGTEAPVK